MTLSRIGPAAVVLIALLGGSPALGFTSLYSMPLKYTIHRPDAECVLELVPLHPSTVDQPEGNEVEAVLSLTRGKQVRRYTGTLIGRGTEFRGRLKRETTPGIKTLLVASHVQKKPKPLRIRVYRSREGTRVQLGSTTYEATRRRTPTDRGWHALPASEKRKILQGIAYLHPYPAKEYPLLGTTKVLAFGKVRPRVDAYREQSDVRLPNWKLRNRHGATAIALYSPAANTEYTGLFNSTCYAVLRLSVDVDASGMRTLRLELKLLADGKRSQNLFATAAGNASEAFGQDLDCDLEAFQLDRLAEWDAKGATVDAPWAPQRLNFVPVHPNLPGADFREQLTRVKEGAPLFEVYDGRGTLVARIGALNPFVVGDAQDRILNFALPRKRGE